MPQLDLCGNPILIDLEQRDPHEINKHIAVQYKDVIAETRQFDSCSCVWDATSFCYECWFNICYQLPVFFCSCCIAAGWGCEFARIVFLHVFFATPCLNMIRLCLHPFKCLWSLSLKCICSPFCETCSYVFGAFEDPNRDPDDPFRTRLF